MGHVGHMSTVEPGLKAHHLIRLRTEATLAQYYGEAYLEAKAL